MSHGNHSKNWGKTPSYPEDRFKSKSSQNPPKKNHPWLLGNIAKFRQPKFPFWGGLVLQRPREPKKMLGHESDWELERRNWLNIWRLCLCFQKTRMFSTKALICGSGQIHPNARPLYTHKLQTTWNIQHHLLPATSSTGTGTSTNSNSNKNKNKPEEEPPPFRIGQVTQSPRCGQNGHVPPPSWTNGCHRDQTLGLDQGIIGLKEVLPCGSHLNSFKIA